MDNSSKSISQRDSVQAESEHPAVVFNTRSKLRTYVIREFVKIYTLSVTENVVNKYLSSTVGSL